VPAELLAAIGRRAAAGDLPTQLEGSPLRATRSAEGEGPATGCALHPLPAVEVMSRALTGGCPSVSTSTECPVPFAGPAPPAALFHYSPDRRGEHPQQHLAGYAGILQPTPMPGSRNSNTLGADLAR
jgi:hypothetical protein